ncbi:MAG: long-chain acyl-CoA synthetase, partial [Cognaticolwellia sp.]
MQIVAKGNDMTKPWMKNYPENVAHEVDLTRY